MIQIQRTKLTHRGECCGFVLELQFDAKMSDRRFEAFVGRFHLELSELRLVNLAASIAARVVEIDTSDVLGDDPTTFLLDVRRALQAAGCGAELAVPFKATGS